jgi:hypothetical protein
LPKTARQRFQGWSAHEAVKRGLLKDDAVADGQRGSGQPIRSSHFEQRHEGWDRDDPLIWINRTSFSLSHIFLR